jgi:hypothetical protein
VLPVSQQFFFQYGGYELHCRPHDEGHGHFSARLRIVHLHGNQRDEQVIDLSEVPTFDSAEEAADHARVIGQAWIDKHAGPRQ